MGRSTPGTAYGRRVPVCTVDVVDANGRMHGGSDIRTVSAQYTIRKCRRCCPTRGFRKGWQHRRPEKRLVHLLRAAQASSAAGPATGSSGPLLEARQHRRQPGVTIDPSSWRDGRIVIRTPHAGLSASPRRWPGSTNLVAPGIASRHLGFRAADHVGLTVPHDSARRRLPLTEQWRVWYWRHKALAPGGAGPSQGRGLRAVSSPYDGSSLSPARRGREYLVGPGVYRRGTWSAEGHQCAPPDLCRASACRRFRYSTSRGPGWARPRRRLRDGALAAAEMVEPIPRRRARPRATGGRSALSRSRNRAHRGPRRTHDGARAQRARPGRSGTFSRHITPA
jgi:hypothetical protein